MGSQSRQMRAWGEPVFGGRDEIGLIALLGTVQVESLVLVDPEVCGRPAAAEDGLGSGGVVDPVDQEAIIDVHRPRPRRWSATPSSSGRTRRTG